MSPAAGHRVLLTGIAGFIGSTLAERLLDNGYDVMGVDCFSDNYDPAVKRANIAPLLVHPGLSMTTADLRTCPLEPLLDGVEIVFHLAGEPGVRTSWAGRFDVYLENNVRTTQRLLDAVAHRPIRRFVYASSSSVYGLASRYPTGEDQPTRPHSPYGVTKLTAEFLCSVYAANFGVPTVALRYFSVYGPRQRPDLAAYRLVSAALDGGTFTLFGSGAQIRDFTYVADAVAATVAAGTAAVPPGTVLNVAGGAATTVNDLIALVAETVGDRVRVDRHPFKPGDVARTGGEIERARSLLGWSPTTSLRDGIRRQVKWQVQSRRPTDGRRLVPAPSPTRRRGVGSAATSAVTRGGPQSNAPNSPSPHRRSRGGDHAHRDQR